MKIRWIPISDTTPPILNNGKSDLVDVKLKDGSVFEGYLNKKEWLIMFDGSDNWFVNSKTAKIDVTHWKPTGWKID